MTRPDNPRTGSFNHWHDAYHEALFRADLTGYRYRVSFEPDNRWWEIRALPVRHAPEAVKETR